MLLAPPKWAREHTVELEEGRAKEGIVGPSRCVPGQLI